MGKKIPCRRTRTPEGVSVEAAHRFVRQWTSEGIRFEPNLERPPKGSFLDPAINRYFVALQTELLATEGWPSPEILEAASNARASESPPENTPAIHAYFERMWGLLKYPELHSTDL